MRQSAPNVLIAGASARAAAFSAFRGGLSVAAADQFADCDLALVADATEIGEWPQGVLDWAATFPKQIPLIYTGGLENEPQLLHDLQRQRPVLGIVGERLESVRNPEKLQGLFASDGIRYAETYQHIPNESPANPYLVKRRKSGGGRGIRVWEGTSLSPDEYLQRFYEGESYSAAYLAQAGECELLGVARALTPHADSRDPFRYQGSVTVDLASGDQGQLRAIGNCLAKNGMQGVFGVDYIRTGGNDGEWTVLEVNPRYTASMELHELRSGRSFVADHLRSFGYRRLSLRKRPVNALYFGKRIVYAPRQLRSGEFRLPVQSEVRVGDYSIADIPAAGAIHQMGAPICTVIVAAESSEACDPLLADLEEKVLSACEAV